MIQSLSASAGPRSARLLILAACAALMSACGQGQTDEGRSGPAEVGYVVVQPTSVALSETYPGRVVAFQSSEVRPQVSGLVERRLFTEGGLVRAGQPLFQIDPSLYRAAVNQAQANLEAARATLASAAELEDYVNAVAAARSARAGVSQAEASLDTARINLRFTTVPAPISGRIGRSLVTPGALATTSQAEPLATIQQLDPIFIDIQQSANDLIALRRSIAQGGAQPNQAQVRLTLADGSSYGPSGQVEVSEVVVDPATGAVTLRARSPIPKGFSCP
ncbi:hypothetical protein LTR94_025190, partial [Friedmanniomyces endolithicus]